MRSLFLGSLAMIVVLFGAATYASAGTICPDINTAFSGGGGGLGQNPGGTTNCDVIFTINGDNTVTVTTPSALPYERNEDQLIGIVNNSASSISSLTVSGSSDLFGFDNDGVCIGYALTGCGTGSTGTGAMYA
ncbi:MAG: hypothetical protein M3Z35_11235, partial [Nitrospirota bacterium]|nr:hypothetical protein [Nitrospirota bacterium]